jgi:hypothetical protein
VEKLRDFFRRRGATVGAGVLATLLTSESIKAAPAGLSGTVTATSTTTAAAAGGSTAAAAAAKGAMLAMAMHKTAVVAAAGLVLLLGIGGGAVAIRSMTAGGTRTRQVSVPIPAPAPLNGPAVTFSDGSIAAVLGIGEMPAPTTAQWVKSLVGGGTTPSGPTRPARWWSANGSPQPEPKASRTNARLSAGDAPGRRQVFFVFSLRGPAATDSGLAVRVDGTMGSASTSNTNGQENIEQLICSVPNNADTTDVRLGISKGPWREDASMTVPTATQPTTRTSGPQMFKNIREEKGRLLVDMTIPFNRGEERDARFAAVLKNGREVRPQEWRSTSGGHATVTFPCRKDELTKIMWITRPYEWQTIANVALKPAAAATQPTARVAASGK